MQKLDYILVHGYDLKTDGSLDEILISRLDLSLDLFEDGWSDNMIVAAKYGKRDADYCKNKGITQSMCLKEYLVSHDVPSEIIFEEREGKNTFDCSKNAYDNIIKPKKWNSGIFVSSAEHLPRIIIQNQKIFQQNMMLFYAGPPILNSNKKKKFLAHELEAIKYTLSKDN